MSTPISYCSDISRQKQESLFGSAPHVRVWLLLEYTEEWRAKAVTDNNLPQSVKDWRAATLDTVDKSRLLFIKQPPHEATNSISFYVAVTHERNSRLYNQWCGY